MKGHHSLWYDYVSVCQSGTHIIINKHKQGKPSDLTIIIVVLKMGLFPLHLFETNDIVVNRPPGVDLVPAIPMAT